MDPVRFGVCDYNPFTYVASGRAFGPWVLLATRALPDDVDYVVETLPAESCNAAGMQSALAAGVIDLAVHPMLMDSECGGCVWSYPMTSNGLLMVADEKSNDDSPYLGSVDLPSLLVLAAVAAAFVLSSLAMARRHHIGDHLTFSTLTLFNNLHVPEGASAPTYLLYLGMTVTSTLVLAIYFANLTADVLRDRDPVGMNVRGFVNSGRQFNVMAGGPASQLLFEYPDARAQVVDDLSLLPSLMLWEQGTRAQAASCLPITAVSGAINRIPYSMAFRPGFEHTAVMNGRLASQAITDVGQSEMLAWIQQKYQCPTGVAVQVGVAEVLPFLYSTLIIYIVAWAVTVLLRNREAASEEATAEP